MNLVDEEIKSGIPSEKIVIGKNILVYSRSMHPLNIQIALSNFRGLDLSPIAY